MKFIKNLDTFGTSFIFTIFNRDKYLTTVGGIITIITYVIIIIFTILFGKNFFYKLNPNVLIAEIHNNLWEEPIIIDNQNFPIIWRIDNNLKYFNIEYKLHPRFRYFEYKKNNLTKDYDMEYSKDISYELCDNLNLSNLQYYEHINTSEWYCLDWSDYNYTFGGSWESDFIHYFGFSINTDFKDASNYNIEDLYINFIFPNYYFDINNNTLLKKKHKNYFYKIGLNIEKLDRIYFERIFSQDDQGWILEDIKENNIISFNTIDSDYYFLEKNNETLNLYESIFYMKNDILQINRSYMKIQDLGAEIGGLMKFIMVFSSLIVNPYNLYSRNEHLFNELFSHKEFKKQTKPILNTISNTIKDKIELKKILESKGELLYKQLETEMKITNKNDNIRFGFFKTLKFQYCNGYSNKHYHKELKIYNFFINYIRERLDISFYIKFIEKVRYLRILLLDKKEHNIAFDFIKNPDISDARDLNKYEINIEKDQIKQAVKLITYYRKLKSDKKITERDMEVYELLNPVIKKFIGNFG